jgi:pimeloyl-ACP methyl ester carboxylesterase
LTFVIPLIMKLFLKAYTNWLAIAVFVFAGCDKDQPQPQITPEILIGSTGVTTKSQADIADFIKSRGLPVPTDQIKSSVTVHKITYKTTFKGQEITASGLVTLPDTDEEVGMLSFQHGTIAANDEAPSLTPGSSSLMMFYSAMATPGLIGVAPDLIGFGSSNNVLHPYYLEEPTATAVLDCLKAARELALVNGLKFNGKLFLAGYSQGGYATMAAHKAIETDGLENFTLIASFPSSGGYDIKGVQKFFFQQSKYDEPFYLAYVAMAYKTHIGWTQPISDLFKEPYASKIPALFDGKKTAGKINEELTSSIPDLIQADILTKIDIDAKYNYINEAFDENSLTDWTPKVKMFMYHGDIDITVPYQNSVDTYNTFIANGASPDVVKFTPLPFSTHGSGVTPYIVHFMNQLLLLK